MLQAYCDESVKDGLFVLAGYLATAEKWAAFSDEWSKLLGMRSPHYPRLDEFHMTEMRHTPERRELSEIFYRVIENHVDAAIACIVDIRALKEAIDEVGSSWPEIVRPYKNPYFAAFADLIPTLADFREENLLLEQIQGPVDFVFDISTTMSHCVEAWGELVDAHRRLSYRRHIVGPPIFRDSMATLPLQAADLWSYWIREWSFRGLPIQEIGQLPFPWKPKKQLEILYIRRTKEDYKRIFSDAILLNQLINAGVFRVLFAPNPLVLLTRRSPSERNVSRPSQK